MIHDTFQDLLAFEKQGRWDDILELTDHFSDEAAREDCPGWFWFFLAAALLQTSRKEEAIKAVERGLMLSPEDSWGNKIYFDALIAAGYHSRAFENYQRFIETTSGHESEKEWFIEKAVELGYFEIAARMNATRDKIENAPKIPRYALALQCFVKADTLEQVLESFLKLDASEEFSLVILQDSIRDGIYSNRTSESERVACLLGSYIPKLSEKFFSVEVLRNYKNFGTAPSCKRLLDYVTSFYDGFIFVEDDCVLDRSALEWTRYHLDNTLCPEGSWFVSCESICFDTADKDVSVEHRELLTQIARHVSLNHAYSYVDFVPSTCFATRKEFWRLCANARGFTRGPESLSFLTRQFGRKTIVPIVPRAADIGMKHALGYSVTNLGYANVKENKNVICMADVKFDSSLCNIFDKSLDDLFQATSEINIPKLSQAKELYVAEIGQHSVA